MGETAGWLAPCVILALLPKCPVCLAAYVALGTGFTLSHSSAHVLMHTLTILGISALAFCVLRRIIKYLRQKPSLKIHTPPKHP